MGNRDRKEMSCSCSLCIDVGMCSFAHLGFVRSRTLNLYYCMNLVLEIYEITLEHLLAVSLNME
jgi:hypothetical protein